MKKVDGSFSQACFMMAHALDECLQRELPSDGGHQLWPDDVTGRDMTEAYGRLKARFADSRSAVLSLVEMRRAHSKWPRGKFEVKFWLRARFLGASALYRYLAAEMHTPCAIPEIYDHGSVYQAVAASILQGRMDEHIVDLWICHTIRDLAESRRDCCHELAEIVAADRWIDQVADGCFLPAARELQRGCQIPLA